MRSLIALLMLLASMLSSTTYAYGSVAEAGKRIRGVSDDLGVSYLGDKASSLGRRLGISVVDVEKASDPRLYYGARYYDARTSVWQSPDPLIVEEPEELARATRFVAAYTYAFNHPLNYSDPDGRKTSCDGSALNVKVCSIAELETIANGGGPKALQAQEVLDAIYTGNMELLKRGAAAGGATGVAATALPGDDVEWLGGEPLDNEFTQKEPKDKPGLFLPLLRVKWVKEEAV